MRRRVHSRATARTWAGLVVLLVPAVLTSMDISVLFVAGPTITRDLRLTPTQWLWAMDLYGFVMAGLLIAMGSLGDRIGRRRLLLIGAAAFGVASALLAFAPTAELLIAGRGTLAVGGATLAPATLSLVRGLFPDETDRRTALGAWTVAFSGGAVCGPIIAGVLLDHFWWGSVFLINVPAMIALLIAAPFLVPESRAPTGARFDLLGAVTSLIGILCLVFALKDVVLHGLNGVAALSAFIGVATMIIFLSWQRRSLAPLVDLSLFRSRFFSGGVLANVTVAAVTGGVGVLVFPYLQVVLGLSPFWSAICGLPPLAGSFLGAASATRLARFVPERAVISLGLICCAIGLALVAAAAPSSILWQFLAGYTVIIFSAGLTATMANSLVIGHSTADRVGAAAGISESSNQLGTAAGIAVLGGLSTAIYREEFANHGTAAPEAAARSLSDAVLTAQAMPQATSNALLQRAYSAYVDGLATAAFASSLVACVLAVCLSIALRRSWPPSSSTAKPPGK